MNINESIQSLRKPLMGCLTALSLLAAPVIMPGCDSDDGAEQSADFRGQELFTGIFFNTGPAGGMVDALSPETGEEFVSSLTEEEWSRMVATAEANFREAGLDQFAEVLENTSLKDLQGEGANRQQWDEQVANLFVDMIAAEDPGFFDRFAADIQSGDHYRVAEAMGEAGEYTLAALTALSQSSSDSGDAGLCLSFSFIVNFNLDLSVLNVIILFGLDFTDVEEVTKVTDVSSKEASLQGEAIIHEVTTTFGR